jgi:prevent-host-death family protein
MSTVSLHDLRKSLGAVVREVAHTGHEAIITDNGKEAAVIISMADYERLHEHADIADALRLRELRTNRYATMTLAEMLDELGVGLDDIARPAAPMSERQRGNHGLSVAGHGGAQRSGARA